jgi:hypothetical protein
VELLRGGSDNGRAPAAGALKNLAVADDAITAAVGAVPPMVELLRDAGSAEGRSNAAMALVIILSSLWCVVFGGLVLVIFWRCSPFTFYADSFCGLAVGTISLSWMIVAYLVMFYQYIRGK